MGEGKFVFTDGDLANLVAIGYCQRFADWLELQKILDRELLVREAGRIRDSASQILSGRR